MKLLASVGLTSRINYPASVARKLHTRTTDREVDTFGAVEIITAAFRENVGTPFNSNPV